MGGSTPLAVLVTEAWLWFYGLVHVLPHAQLLYAKMHSDDVLHRVANLWTVGRVCSAAAFLVYYVFLKMQMDPFGRSQRRRFMLCEVVAVGSVAAAQVLTPRAHWLTLTVLLAAVALVTSALVSAIGCTAMIFMAVDDPPRRITPTCPFLGRIQGHLMLHAGLVRRLVRHPDEVELVMLGNVVAFPLSAFALAKCWMQTPSLLWPVLPRWLWKWSWTLAILTQIILIAMVVDGGLEKKKKLPKKLARSHSDIDPLAELAEDVAREAGTPVDDDAPLMNALYNAFRSGGMEGELNNLLGGTKPGDGGGARAYKGRSMRKAMRKSKHALAAQTAAQVQRHAIMAQLDGDAGREHVD